MAYSLSNNIKNSTQYGCIISDLNNIDLPLPECIIEQEGWRYGAVKGEVLSFSFCIPKTHRFGWIFMLKNG